MNERVLLSEWKSPEAEQRFRATEDALAQELMAEIPTRLEVETRLGPTCAYRWDGDGEPLVFLHGSSGTSLSWARYAEARAGRATYAIDTIGDVGRSEQRAAVESADDLAEWLDETLAALGVEHAHLVGTSYGGFLALNLAARRPARVRSLVLIEPAGIVRVQLARFMVWGFASMLASWLPNPPRQWAATALRAPHLEDKRILRFVMQGQLNHRTRVLRPEPLSDAQLSAIDQPVLTIIGAKSEVFPPAAVRARIAAFVPKASIDVIEGSGHAVLMSATDHITERITTFVAAQERSRG